MKDAPQITVLSAAGTTQIPFEPGEKLRDALELAGLPVRSDCGGHAVCGLCQVQLADSASIPTTSGERQRLKPEQLAGGVRLACQIETLTGMQVTLLNPALRTEWRPLREDEYSPVAVAPGRRPIAGRLGLAIDVGTTHIRLALWDLQRGQRLAGRTGLNPQLAHGSDVLTRLMLAVQSAKVAARLRRLLVDGIAEAVAGMVRQASAPDGAIDRVELVGNTAMLALFTGKGFERLMDPAQWTDVIDYQPDDTAELKAAWQLAENAEVRFLPPMGGFVGADLLAGIVATGLMQAEPGSLLIDFGTNSEMALWDGQHLHVTSTAGGPAFEGSGISCGMPAEIGAIFRVAADDSGYALDVIGGGAPRGICGSGLVDLMAALRRSGQLDKVGRLRADCGNRVLLADGEHPVSVLGQDIDIFQRAKAAIAAGALWLCHDAGMRSSELRQVYVCGAFGRLLDPASARDIGLLPQLPPQRIRLSANTALAGCEMLLLDPDAMLRLAEIRLRSRVVNLAEDLVFESLFVQNLYVQPIED